MRHTPTEEEVKQVNMTPENQAFDTLPKAKSISFDEVVEQILAETKRWLDQETPKEPEHLICLEDIRFAVRFARRVETLHAVMQFVRPLVGKTIKINGFKFIDPLAQGHKLFRTELDYEEVK